MRKAARSGEVRRARAAPAAPRVTFPASPDGGANAVGGHGMEKEIEEIERLSLDDLQIRWRNLWGRLAPAHLSRSLLARLMAYRLQARAFGDLDRLTARALERRSAPNGRERANGQTPPAGAESVGVSTASERRVHEPLVLKPGTLLTREWQGRMETVMVVADGFAWNGAIFASLSAVAQAITGTKWNGHRFFGVRPLDRAIRDPKAIGSGDIRPVERAMAAGDPPLRRDGNVQTTGPGAVRNRPSRSSSVARRMGGDAP